MDLIIARYEENLNWIEDYTEDVPIESIYIYTKGSDTDACHFAVKKRLPNIGYEAHTYLWHIINNWDNLADVNVFLPGDAIVNDPGLFDSLLLMKGELSYFPIGREYYDCDAEGIPQDYLPEMEEMWKKLFNMPIPHRFVFVAQGMFAVSKDVIYLRDKSFYEKAIRLVETKKEACAFERFWHYVFIPQRNPQAT